MRQRIASEGGQRPSERTCTKKSRVLIYLCFCPIKVVLVAKAVWALICYNSRVLYIYISLKTGDSLMYHIEKYLYHPSLYRKKNVCLSIRYAFSPCNSYLHQTFYGTPLDLKERSRRFHTRGNEG